MALIWPAILQNFNHIQPKTDKNPSLYDKADRLKHSNFKRLTILIKLCLKIVHSPRVYQVACKYFRRTSSQ